jgi:hypothetical protein
MTDNQFDDIIRKRLESHESVVPADMLERITENDKGRKTGFVKRWYILILLLLLTAITTTYFFVSKSGNTTVDENAVVSKKSLHDGTGESKEKNSSQNILSSGLQNNSPDSNDANKQIHDRAFTSIKNNIKRSSKNTPPVSYDDKTFSRGTLADNRLKTIDNKDIFHDSLVSKPKPGMPLQKDSAASAVAKTDEETNIPDKFSLELYASPVIPFNSIASSSSNYEHVLKHASAMQLSYTFGARLDFAVSKKFGVKIGVQYAQVNEKMAFADSALSENHVSKNRYKFIDIPVLVSYKTAWPGYVHTAVNTGILVNIATRYKGLIPGSAGGAISMSDASVYYRNTGISVYFGVGLSKEINNRIGIFSEPYFRYHVKNMANSFQPFDQKIHTAGISLGLKYNLSKKVND